MTIWSVVAYQTLAQAKHAILSVVTLLISNILTPFLMMRMMVVTLIMIIVIKIMVIISFPEWPCLLHSSLSSPLSLLRLLILWKVISIDAVISTMMITWLSWAPWRLPDYYQHYCNQHHDDYLIIISTTVISTMMIILNLLRGGGLYEPRGLPGHKQRMLFWRRPRQPQKRNRGETHSLQLI